MRAAAASTSDNEIMSCPWARGTRTAITVERINQQPCRDPDAVQVPDAGGQPDQNVPADQDSEYRQYRHPGRTEAPGQLRPRAAQDDDTCAHYDEDPERPDRNELHENADRKAACQDGNRDGRKAGAPVRDARPRMNPAEQRR